MSAPRIRQTVRRPSVGRTAALLLAGCLASSPVQAAPPSATAADAKAEELAFKLCESEAFLALNSARQYLFFGRKKESVLPYLSAEPFDQQMAAELFRRADANELRHHAPFAAEALQRCTTREGLKLGVETPRVEACFAATDIPFFLSGLLDQGQTREQAIARVLRVLPNRETHPAELVTLSADKLGARPTLEHTRHLMRSLFWNCVYD